MPKCQSLRLLLCFLRSQPSRHPATARRTYDSALKVVCLSVTGLQEWFACWFDEHKQIDRTDVFIRVLGGTVLRRGSLVLFHGNTDQDTQRIDMSQPRQQPTSAPAAARREKPKYRGGAGADHVRPTNTPAPVRIVFFFSFFLLTVVDIS